MAQECGFFNAQLQGDQFDRVYLAEQFAAYFAAFIGNGVYGHSMQKLQVLCQDVPNMSIKVLSGEAYINGWWYRNTDTYNISIPVADGVLSRIDVVVVRWGNTERDMWLQLIQGTPSANPVKPAIRRDADYYDLQLATIAVPAGTIRITQAQIQDTRLDNSVCGLVTGVVDQIDTTNLYNQFEAYFNEFKENYEADFEDWTAEQQQAYIDFITNKQNAYNQWTAEKMIEYTQFVNTSEQNYTDYIQAKQSEYEDFVEQSKSDYDDWTEEQRQKYLEWYGVHTVAWEKEFNDWFESIKDILSGDVAGNLQLEIEDLQKRVTKLENFATDMVYKQEAYPVLIDTRYDEIAGDLTNDQNVVITNDLDDPIEMTKITNEPILDENSEKIRSIIKFALL